MARGSIVTRIQKDGTKRYAAVLSVGGKQKWKTFARKKDAEDHLDDLSPAVRDGSYREVRKATFGEYSNHWKATHCIQQNMKPSTLASYRAVFDRHLKPEFEHYNMQGISAAEINSFKAKLQKKGLGPKSIRNTLNLLSRFFADAVDDKYLRHNPMADVNKPEVSRKRKGRALGPLEIQALLANAGDPETHLVIMMAILTGVRRGELFGLRWEDVDFQHDVIHVRQSLFWKYGKSFDLPDGDDRFTFHAPKSETSVREIDLSPALKKELRQRYLASKKAGLVFTAADGRPRDPNGFYKEEFTNAVNAAKLGKVRFHDLRHTFGALKLEQGENIYYIQRQMGHSSIQVTIDIYGHLLETRKPDAAAKTDDFIFNAKAKDSDGEDGQKTVAR